MNTAEALEITRVDKVFRTKAGPLTAVNKVSLSVGQGEILALLGENGAGKTTLLDMLLGLTQPTSGEIRVLGLRPREAIAAGKINAVLQTGGLLKDLSVRDQVAMVAATYRRSISVDSALEAAGISDIARQKIAACSGGQQQKVRFALALLGRPDILVLDEPTTGMDANARQQFWASMQRQAQLGKTIIFATHYLEEAQNFAQRVVLMSAGSIRADDSVRHLRSATGTRKLSFSLTGSRLDPQLLHDFQISDLEIVDDFYYLTTSQAEDLLRFLLDRYPVQNLEVTAPSLNDEFIHLATQPTADLSRS